MTPETLAELRRRHAALTPFALRFLSNGPGGELRRRHAALTPFALRFLSNGPGGEPFIALACEDGSTPLPEPAFDAVLLFSELAAAELPALLDAADELLVCKTVAAHRWLERAAELRAALDEEPQP